jgi:hypothetical protein
MEKIYLNIAGFKLLFKIHPRDQRFYTEKFIQMLKTDYSGFITKAGKGADFTFDIYSYGLVVLSGEDLAKKTNSFNVRLFHINEKTHTLRTHNPPGNFDFEFMVNMVLNKYLLSSADGFTIHGSGVSYNDKAYIFEGSNGAGKSTTAQLLNGLCNILSDDSILIRKMNKKFYFFQTLQYEKNYNFAKNKKSYPIDKVFFIRKANKCAVKEIKNKNFILKKMLKQLFTYPDKIKKQFPLIAEFVDKTEFYYLYIKKDEKVFKQFFKKEILKI